MSEQMQAGPELDELIATKIMGWKKGVDFDYVDHLESVVRYIPSTNDVLIFNPSLDWNSMRLVVEEMRRIHAICIDIEVHPYYYTAKPANIDGYMGLDTDSEHAPHAVCLAALKALEADTHD